MVIFMGCEKQTKKPAPVAPTSSTCQPPSGLSDIQWKPVLTGYTELTFGSNGKYYESYYNEKGTWNFACTDSIKIQTPYYKLCYRVVSLSSDTLKIKDILLNTLTYYK